MSTGFAAAVAIAQARAKAEQINNMSAEEQTPEQMTIYQAHWLAEFKRQNACLERMAVALEAIQERLIKLV